MPNAGVSEPDDLEVVSIQLVIFNVGERRSP